MHAGDRPERPADLGPQRSRQPADQHRGEPSRTDTYKEGDTHGVRGVNTVGDIRIGGDVAGVRTPSLVIEGLTTSANAFHTPQGFGHAEAFDFASIRLELLEGTPLQGTPLEALLAPLDQVTDTVFEGTNDVANEIFKVLQSATAPIQIPGLGSIALGKVRGTATSKKATSEAMALEIVVDAGGSRQLLEIGSANARIGAPTPAGVFRAGGTALDLQALQSALHFGNVQHKSIPCEGTLGKTKSLPRPHRRRPLRTRGARHRRHLLAPRQPGREEGPRQGLLARSEIATHLGARGRPGDQRHRQLGQDARQGEQAGEVEGHLEHRVDHLPGPARRRTRNRVRRSSCPTAPDLIQRQLVKDSRYGAKSIGLRVQLFANAVVLDLGAGRRAHLPALIARVSTLQAWRRAGRPLPSRLGLRHVGEDDALTGRRTDPAADHAGGDLAGLDLGYRLRQLVELRRARGWSTCP